MTLQNIRHYYEQPIVDWCATNAVELRADNMIEPNSDAAAEFLVTRFNFGQFTEQTLCGAIENVRGSLIVEFFSPKGTGPARAQTVMLGVMSELIGLTDRPIARDTNGVLGTLGPITGPSFTALDDRPYFFATMSAPVLASVGEPAIDINLLRRLEALEDTHDRYGRHNSGSYVDLKRETRGPTKNFELRLSALEAVHTNGGHDSGSYVASGQSSSSSSAESFDSRLTALEIHHDANRGHNSSSF